jgi:NAD(P)-dependent dehydrogenase (short-subunit alcohol dehydrogenase family)
MMAAMTTAMTAAMTAAMMEPGIVAERLGGALRELVGVASYPAAGYWLRHRGWDPTALDVDLAGKVCVVTGASRGLGFATARALARRGATVVMVCRDRAHGAEARRAIVARGGAERVRLEACDVADLGAVRAFAARFHQQFSRLDVLVNNAGVLLETLQRSADGHEATFATNVLGGYHLARLLLPRLAAAAPSRIIHVGSAALYLQRLDVDALRADPGAYAGELAYARSKRALAELNTVWAERLAGTGVTSNLMHPGLTATPGVERSFPRYARWCGPILRNVDQGADTMVWLAVARAVRHESGKLWFDRRARPAHVVPWTRSARGEPGRLWDACAAMCGLPPELGSRR